MQANDFEFRNRFWLIGAIFAVAFWCYAFDHVNVMQAAANRIAGKDSPGAEHLVRIFLAVGALLTFLAAAIRTWATAYLRSEIVHDKNVHSEALVADGPYCRVRNPLYLGNILLAVGIGFLASRTGFVVLVLGMTLFVLRLIGREEAQLEREQGGRFREFCRRVPRLIPAIAPRVPAGGLTPHWGQAFAGETFIWGPAVGMLAFAITLKNYLLWAFLAAGLLLRFGQDFLKSKRSKPARTP
jgi:protein-S-isoprenylcysteine O-methyltransferase Ste14